MKRREFITLLGGAAARGRLRRGRSSRSAAGLACSMTLSSDNVEGQSLLHSWSKGLRPWARSTAATCILMPAGRGTTSTAYALMQQTSSI